MHTYNDILITAKQGYNFWNLLFDGKAFDFYLESKMVTGNPYYPRAQGAAYLFPIYLIFAIWNFPTWLLETITGQSLFNSIPSMIWMKLMLVPFIAFSAFQIYKIVSQYKKEYAHLAAFLFISSIITIYPTAIIGQYDILGMPFILWGISAWMKKNNRSFLIAFSLAIIFKYFALLYFLPLLLLREKRIRYILVDFVLILIPSLIFTVVFPRPQGSTGNLQLIYRLLDGIQVYSEAKLYIFAAVVAFALLAIYFMPHDDSKELQIAFFFLFIIMASFCIFAKPSPYWVIFAVPAFVLVFFFSEKNTNKLLLLETALCWGITIKNYFIYPFCVGIETVGGMGILHRILGVSAPDLSDTFSVLERIGIGLERIGIDQSFVFTALFVGLVLAIVFSSPRSKHNKMWEPLNNGTLYLRTLGNAFLAVLPAIGCAIHMLLQQ